MLITRTTNASSSPSSIRDSTQADGLSTSACLPMAREVARPSTQNRSHVPESSRQATVYQNPATYQNQARELYQNPPTQHTNLDPVYLRCGTVLCCTYCSVLCTVLCCTYCTYIQYLPTISHIPPRPRRIIDHPGQVVCLHTYIHTLHVSNNVNLHPPSKSIWTRSNAKVEQQQRRRTVHPCRICTVLHSTHSTVHSTYGLLFDSANPFSSSFFSFFFFLFRFRFSPSSFPPRPHDTPEIFPRRVVDGSGT